MKTHNSIRRILILILVVSALASCDGAAPPSHNGPELLKDSSQSEQTTPSPTLTPSPAPTPTSPSPISAPGPSSEPLPDSTYKEFPILMYHTSSEKKPGDRKSLYVKPSEFEKQISYLVDEGYTFCTFDEYESVWMYEKPIFITWDDGYYANYTEIFPLLKKYEVKITLFLIWGNLSPNGLTESMVKEMSDSGLVKIESHTLTHPSLPGLSKTNLETQLAESKKNIEELTGKPVLALSYPNGEFNDTVKASVAGYYAYGLRKDKGMNNNGVDPFEIRRIRINRDTSLVSFKKWIKVS